MSTWHTRDCHDKVFTAASYLLLSWALIKLPYVQHVVASDEKVVTELGTLAIYNLLWICERHVEVVVTRGEHALVACVVELKLDDDRFPYQLLDEWFGVNDVKGHGCQYGTEV